ncbi:MAG: hypothetical protein AB7I18_01305 [Candidatus Berkiella sp.]
MQGSTPILTFHTIELPSAFALTHVLYNHQVEKINEQLTSKPLAQQSVNALLTLLEGPLFSLSQRYVYLLSQGNDKQNQTILNVNQQKIVTLTKKIHQHLLQESQCPSLSDDSRLIIYDILMEAGFNKELLYQRIIQRIPKRTYQKLKEAKIIKKSLSEIYGFTQQVSEALAIKRTRPNRLQAGITDFTRQLNSITMLWQLRYLCYFMLSLGAYFLLMQAVTMAGAFILSEKLLAFISSMLFYGVGLFPFWCLSGQFLVNAWERFIGYWRLPKQSQIVEALYHLEHTQQWIGYRLNQVIIDIARADVEALRMTLLQKQQIFNSLKAQLRQFTMAEKLLVGRCLKTQARAVYDKLQKQEIELEMAIKGLIRHLTYRVKEELMLLEKSQGKSWLLPLLSAKQYLQIKVFIATLGTKDDLDDFEKKTNIAALWQNQLPQFTLADKHEHRTQQQPWGSHVLRHDILQGWQTLLTQWEINSTAKSARVLNELLQGKRELSMAALVELVKKLGNQKKESELLLAIQTILFNTLSARAPQTACLLGKPHKHQILVWYQQHKGAIRKAKQAMEALLNDQTNKTFARFNDEQLAEYYILLEGADIYHYSQNGSHSIVARQNRIREFFANYDGQTSRAFLLLRFIPEHLKPSLHVTIAQKRLCWLLSQLGKEVNAAKPFDEHDLELFLAHTLSRQDTTFNIAQVIGTHPAFAQPSIKAMRQFLIACRQFGLDDGRLLREYQAKTVREGIDLHQYKQYGKKPLSQPLNSRVISNVSRKNLM